MVRFEQTYSWDSRTYTLEEAVAREVSNRLDGGRLEDMSHEIDKLREMFVRLLEWALKTGASPDNVAKIIGSGWEAKV